MEFKDLPNSYLNVVEKLLAHKLKTPLRKTLANFSMLLVKKQFVISNGGKSFCSHIKKLNSIEKQLTETSNSLTRNIRMN